MFGAFDPGPVPFWGIICELRETGGRNLQPEHRRWSVTGLMSDPYAISRDGLGVLVGDRFIFIGESQDDSMGSLGILDVRELKLVLQRPQASQLTSIRYEKGLPCQMQLQPSDTSSTNIEYSGRSMLPFRRARFRSSS